MAVTRVILAEDNKNIRAGIRRLLTRARDIEVVGEAENGIDTLKLVNELNPDVLLLDVEMPLLNGIEVTQRMLKRKSTAHILVLSSYDDREYIQAMLANGVSGYLIKDEAPRRILEAVRGVARGETGWFSSQVSNQINSGEGQGET
jgi:DNA-binding NarL/FixJ family response regulator